jgi:hypothetical protein
MRNGGMIEPSTQQPESNMNEDTIEYFNNQAAAAMARHQSILAKSIANGSFARKQWMTAAGEALRNGAQFCDRKSRQLAKPWDGRISVLNRA